MYESFDHAVCGAADRNQAVSHVVYRLMMGRVYQGTLAVELVKEILTAQTAVIDMVELIAAGPLVASCGDDVLKQIAAEMYIDELEAFADAEHGFFSRDEAGERFELQDVQNGIHMEGTVICLAEESGSDIAAAGKEQMRRAVGLIRVGCSEVGDVHSIQGGFIVSGIRLVTKDGNGWALGHDSFLQYFIVTL